VFIGPLVAVNQKLNSFTEQNKRASLMMDADTNDSVPGIGAGELVLNGVVKHDDLQTAIINKVTMMLLFYLCYDDANLLG